MSYVWKPSEIEELKKLIEEGYTKEQLADHFNRTVTAIQVKVNRLGLAIYNTSDNVGSRGRNWRQSDIEEFVQLWTNPTISRPVMCKKLHRSYYSIRKKALQLDLGPRPVDSEYVTIPDICTEMQVSHDRVSNWLKLGLPKKKSRSGKVRYLIDVDDLLLFLENHQDMFNANLISPYLFYTEPQWLKDKRKSDAKYYPSNLRSEYSNEDDKKIQQMFNRGKSDEEIAEALGRTSTAIAGRRRILNLMRDVWSEEELDILKRFSRYKTVDELTHLLPRRSKKAITWMCEQMKLPYHISKSRCESS